MCVSIMNQVTTLFVNTSEETESNHERLCCRGKKYIVKRVKLSKQMWCQQWYQEVPVSNQIKARGFGIVKLNVHQVVPH